MKKCLLILVLLLIVGCSQSTDTEDNLEFVCTNPNPVEKGNRLIGIDLLDVNEGETFDDNIKKAKDLGIDFITLHLNWNYLEPSPYNYNDPINALLSLGKIASENNIKISLTIRPIDLTGKTVPDDLENHLFNSSTMIERFNSLVDFIFSRLRPEQLLNLQIGNEIDGYDISKEPEGFWSDYGAFLFNVMNYVHESYPQVKVGFTGTLEGLVSKSGIFTYLINSVDLLGVTYYPLNGDFSVKSPESVSEDIVKFLETYPNKPIYFQEVGFQTSEICNSNEDKQAEFFCNFFSIWDKYSDKIKSVNILRLNDLTLEKAKESGRPYGVTDERFIEYHRTLGIRTSSGKQKLAYKIIEQNLKVRNW